MTVQAAYEFLKPSLEKLTDRERQELTNLINGEPAPAKEERKQKKPDPIMSKAQMKKLLLKSHFKNKSYC